MSNFDFTDLILLVGTNPLPNYVVGKYFLGENKGLERIWFVHTNRTGGAKEPLQAERLRDTIANELKFPIQNIKLVNTEHESSAKDIRKKTKDLMISEIEKLKGKIHLNYTGGTKSMSVHVYNEILKSEIESKEFSYLEAQEFKLLRDNPDYPVIEEDMREKVKIKFDNELLKIHGYKKEDKGKKGFEKSISLFYDLTNNINDMKEYLKVLNDAFKGKKDITPINSSYLKDKIYTIINTLPVEYQVFENEKFKTEFLNPPAKPKLKNPNTLLREYWLEYYINDIIKDKNNHIKYDDLILDSSITKKVWKYDFQIDVLFVYGYQLVGISCTVTDDVKECKLKGFEIIHRVKQMGGDEAKAILVTALSNEQVERLQDELLNETSISGDIKISGDISKFVGENIKVLGIEDWKKVKVIEAIKEAIK